MQTSVWVKAFSLLCICIGLTSGQSNLLENGDFEQDLGNIWYCLSSRCQLSRTTDAFAGTYSAKVTNRTSSGEGIRQDARNVKTDAKYFLEARIKLLNEVAAYHKMELYVIIKGDKTDRKTIAIHNYMRICNGWVHIGGDFITYADTTSVTVMALVRDYEQVEYLVDTFSLTEIIPDPDWREHANTRIENIRKGNIYIKTRVMSPLKPQNIVIWINQTRQAFPFGSAIVANRITMNDAESLRYQEYFYSMFNWAVLTNSMKWRFMETTEGEPYFGTVHKTLDALNANNITNVRGHCIAWAKDTKILDWLKKKSPSGVYDSVSSRINYMAEQFGDRVLHWDVNNEMLHGDWYRKKTNNPQFPEFMFHELHKVDRDAKLFTNDYDAVSMGKFTTAYKQQISTFLANGVPIGAAGLQSHLSEFPDMDIFKKRLEVMSTAGVPLWITELDVRTTNVTKRAIGYEDVLRLYYSMPAVSGILFWGFNTEYMATDDASLCDGKDCVENEAGARVRELLTNEWRTQLVHNLGSNREQNNTFRAFHGTHDIFLLNEGQVIWSDTVYLQRGRDVVLDITLS